MGKKEKKKQDTGTPILNCGYEEAENTKVNNTKSEKQKENETITVKIQVVSQNPDKIPPIVGYFPSGYDPLKKSPEGIEKPGSNVSFFRNKKRTNRFQLAVSGSRVNFVGTNYSGEATAAQLCNYSIGVLDKESKTLKIVPIAGNRIIRLDPKLGSSDTPEDENPDKHEMTAEEKATKTRALTDMYSNKKAIRRAKKLDTLRQQADAGAQHEIQGNKLLNQDALEISVRIDNERNIPPYDLGATTPQTAYPLEKIILKGEWDYLSDILELSEAGEHIALGVFPSFVCNRMYTLADIKDETEKLKMAGIFSYITHLVKFKDKHSMDGFSSAKSHKIPGMLFHKFSSMFGVSESRRLPAEKIDLLISYVLVLTLYVDNFRTDPTDIAKDLRMAKGDLVPHFELLGCKFTREKQLHLATLPVPLKFSTRKRRRK